MRLPLLILASLVSTLYGCTVVNVEGKDAHARFPEGEVVVPLNQSEQNSPHKRINAIAAGYSRTSGHAEQELTNGEYLDINNNQIYAPATVDNDVRLGIGYLRFEQTSYIRDDLQWNWGAGLGYEGFHYTGTSGNTVLSFTDKAVGLHGKIGMGYFFNRYVGIEGELGGYVFSEGNDAWLYTSQVRLTLKPVEALRIYAGYRRWNYWVSPDRSGSDINFLLSGPTAGIALVF